MSHHLRKGQDTVDAEHQVGKSYDYKTEKGENLPKKEKNIKTQRKQH